MLAVTSMIGVACAVLVSTQDGVPRVWTWLAPNGPAAANPSFVPLVETYVHPTTDPAAAADEVCDAILARALTSDRIGIVLRNWGRGTLVGAPSDQVPGWPPLMSPWTAAGRSAMSAWTESFIARYRERQNTDGIPDPARWHMDCELRLPALCYLPDVDACWGTDPVRMFDALRSDPRWASEMLLVSPGGQPSARSLAACWKAAGSPSFDASLPRDHSVNHAWSRWWDGISRELIDGALWESFFSRVSREWPASRGSEFAESMRLDGGTEPDGTPREYVDFEWWNRGWMRSQWCGRVALQAPALYSFGETFMVPSMDWWDRNMQLHRANLDSCLHSFGGVPPSEVTPWLTLPRVPLPYGLDGSNRAVGDDEFLRMVALVRSRGIDEFMTWPGGDASAWSATSRAIRAAWDSDLDTATILTGHADGDPSSLLRRADRNILALTPDAGAIAIECTFDGPPRSSSSASGTLWLAVEACGVETPVAVEVHVLLANQMWGSLGHIVLPTSLPGAAWLGPVDASQLVAASGAVRVRLRASAATSGIGVDLMQLVRAAGDSPLPGDVNLDGTVNGTDLGALLSGWGTAAIGPDLNRDGCVTGEDIGALLSGWTP